MVRMAPSCDGAPLPGTSALPRRKRSTSPHFTASVPYSFSTVAGHRVEQRPSALAGSLKPRGVSSGRASSVGTLKPPIFAKRLTGRGHELVEQQRAVAVDLGLAIPFRQHVGGALRPRRAARLAPSATISSTN